MSYNADTDTKIKCTGNTFNLMRWYLPHSLHRFGGTSAIFFLFTIANEMSARFAHWYARFMLISFYFYHVIMWSSFWLCFKRDIIVDYLSSLHSLNFFPLKHPIFMYSTYLYHTLLFNVGSIIRSFVQRFLQ